jgi:hypothetical protein
VQDAASSAICGTVELTDDPQLGVMEVIIGPSFDPGKLEGGGVARDFLLGKLGIFVG